MTDIPGKYSISLQKLLDYVSQEDIMALGFGLYPQEGEYYYSPFRVDTTPDCYFHYDSNEKLRFRDWAAGDEGYLDCFEMVKRRFNLSSYIEVIHFIYDALISGKDVSEYKAIQDKKRASGSTTKNDSPHRTKIIVHRKEFTGKDKEFWDKFGITEKDLQEDKVYPIDKIYLKNKKGEEKIIETRNKKVYADVNFISGNRKVYFPEATGKSLKFITNCTHNDIGNAGNISFKNPYLVITKSHKDHRVLKNHGVRNTVYFSNEGQFPEDILLKVFLRYYTTIYIFFDSDETGRKASDKLKSKICTLHPEKKIVQIFTDGPGKDISDYYLLNGPKKCSVFINTHITTY